MTKRKSTSKQSKSATPFIAVAAVLVVAIAGFLFLSNPSDDIAVTASIQKISANNYVTNYAETTDNHILLDVRTPEEFNEGHIAGAVNIPVQELTQRLSEVPDDKEIIVYCRSGNRSATASNILLENGFSAIYDMGGIIAWQQAGFPIEQ
jgi:phage shock protein E